MTTNLRTPSNKLFYSYCHKDARYKDSMERALSVLRREGHIQEWSDLMILPGQRISPEIRSQMNQANILVFLLSHDFINSDECVKEWELCEVIVR